MILCLGRILDIENAVILSWIELDDFFFRTFFGLFFNLEI